MPCAPAPCLWVTETGIGSWTRWRIPHNHPGNCPSPLCVPPKNLQVRQILFPRPTGGNRGRSNVGVPLSPSTTGPCVPQGISRPVLPSAFLPTQNSPRTTVGGCRGRRFLFLRRHRSCWGRYRDSQVGMSRGDVDAAAGADIRRGSGASSGFPAPCLDHPRIPHFAISLPVWGLMQTPGPAAASHGAVWGGLGSRHP